LKALLVNRQDIFAAEYGKLYPHEANEELIKFAFNNANELFLKNALRLQIFAKQSELMAKPPLVKFFLDELQKGSKVEMILNVLLFSDKSQWGVKTCEAFKDFVSDIVDPSKE
jgi:hypothetical protein